MLIILMLSTVYNGRYWVFFTDKGNQKENISAQIERVAGLYPSITIERRMKAMGKPADRGDLPVYPPYIDSLKKLGFKPRYVSRWLNAVSGLLPEGMVNRIEKLPFVREVKRVTTIGGSFPRIPKTLSYGKQETNIKLMNIDKLHNLGYSGKGVRIGIFDTGFEYGEGAHEALDMIHVIAKADFVFPDTIVQDGDTIIVPDTIVSYEQGEDYREDTYPVCYAPFCCQTDHGTMVLSILAGYAAGSFIGVAFGADYILAKTEQVYDREGHHVELKVEEDNWIRAMEWAESIGVDVVSSSVGYRDFQDTTGYSYADMDGKTAPITIAAESAYARGVIVVNAMGNVSGGAPESSIVAPADGEHVLSIGGVEMEIDSITGDTEWVWCNEAAAYAPDPMVHTAKKPDLAAPFYAQVVNPEWRTEFLKLPGWDTLSIPHYISGGGTSFSTPYVAGIAALLLEAFPSLKGNPDTIRLALISTASRHASPNHYVGHGVPNALAALNFLGEPEVVYKEKNYILPVYPNPFRINKNSVITIPFVLDNNDYVQLKVYDSGGKLVYYRDVGFTLAGRNYTKWVPGDLRPGVYTIIIKTGFTRLRSRIFVLR